MKNNKIAVSWNKIMPDGAADRRMLSAILERSRSADAGNAEAKPTPKRKAVWLRYVAAAAAVVVIAVGMFAVVRFGSESERQQVAEVLPALTPNPNEGVTIFPIDPDDDSWPKRAVTVDRITMSAEKMMSHVKKILRGRVESIQEFGLIPLWDTDPRSVEYRSRAVLTVTDPIYGNIEKGELISISYHVASHMSVNDAIILEEGKEYVLLLNTYPESAVMDSYDYKSVSENYLVGSDVGAMPIDDEGLVNYIPIIGDIGGKALRDGEIKRVGGVEHAYRANYEDIKARLLEFMPNSDATTPPAATATPIPIEISTPAPETSETPIEKND